MTRWRRCGLWISVLWVAAGCGSDSLLAPEGRLRQRISGGEVSESGTDEDAVVLVYAELDNGETTCTATLVAPNLVLTARHCVAHVTEEPFSCTPEGELIEEGTGGGRLGANYPAERLSFFGGPPPRSAPLAFGSEIVSSLSMTVCRDDIAYVVLDRELDLPVRALRLASPARAGEAVHVLGYGVTSDTTGVDPRTQFRARQRDREIVAVGPDSLTDAAQGASPRKFIISNATLCAGDSGGPALAARSGAVLGVFSHGRSSSCNTEPRDAWYTHLAPFTDLARRAFEAAGAEPILEPVADAGSVQDADDAAVLDAAGGCTLEGGCVLGCDGNKDCTAICDGCGPEEDCADGASCNAPERDADTLPEDASTPVPKRPSAGGCAIGVRRGDGAGALALGLLILRRRPRAASHSWRRRR